MEAAGVILEATTLIGTKVDQDNLDGEERITGTTTAVMTIWLPEQTCLILVLLIPRQVPLPAVNRRPNLVRVKKRTANLAKMRVRYWALPCLPGLHTQSLGHVSESSSWS
jgi:hypothetical protein